MMAETMFLQLEEKYGEDFNWMLLQPDNTRIVDELNRELGTNRFDHRIQAIAKCESNDDVLFMISETDWRIYHLTYSANSTSGFPDYVQFGDLQAAVAYIEKDYAEHYR